MLDTKRIHENEDLERKETEAIKFKEDLLHDGRYYEHGIYYDEDMKVHITSY